MLTLAVRLVTGFSEAQAGAADTAPDQAMTVTLPQGPASGPAQQAEDKGPERPVQPPVPQAEERAGAPGAPRAVQGALAGDRPPQARGTVVLNFSDASLNDIIRTIAENTGENFIIAPGVSARVTVHTTKPVQRQDVMGIFESILNLNGLSAVKAGQYYKIVQAPAAKQHSLDLYKKTDALPGGERMVNIVVPVEFISANDVIQILKPSISAAGGIINYQKANTLVITDTAANVKGFLDLIAAMDVDAFRRMSIALIQIKNVDVKTLDRELAEVFTALGYGKDAAQLAVVPIERLNSVILFASSEALLASSREWVERLDRTSSADAAAIHIYYVRNDKASTVSVMLEQLYGGRRPASPSPAAAQRAPAQPQLPAVQQGAQPQAAPSTPPRPDGAGRREGGAAGDDVRIYVYEPSNALIIQSSQRDYQSILNTLQELDRPPKQVLIDALIAEVTLDDGLKYGIQWSLLSGNANVQQNTGIFPAAIANPKAPITAPLGLPAPAGLTAVATDAKKFFGAVQALSTTGKVNVLSNPHILVKNYEKASINVGSDEPVATQSTQTAVTGTAGLIQSIEYRKTGILLTVTPHITEGGVVAMTIRQEVSDKSTDRTVGNAVYPSFTKREAETSVVAKDGESLVIGGMIQDRDDLSASGVPLLSRIPYLGALFRFTTKNTSKTELVILITPRVVSDPEGAAAVSSAFRDRLDGLKELIRKNNYLNMHSERIPSSLLRDQASE